MEEVQNQLGPLKQAVDKQGMTLRSLYSNGSGGPPGYLETAREVDNGRFKELFEMLNDFKCDLQPLKQFMNDHLATEKQIDLDKKELNRKLNVKLIIVSVVIAAISMLSANMASCKGAARSFLSDRSQITPQSASQ